MLLILSGNRCIPVEIVHFFALQVHSHLGAVHYGPESKAIKFALPSSFLPGGCMATFKVGEAFLLYGYDVN